MNHEKGSAGDASKYGLGVWGNTEVNPGDLPIFGTLIGKGQQTTGDNIVAAFAAANPIQLAEIQRALYLAGFYGESYQPSYGVISPEDVQAFGKAVTLAGQAATSVSDLLLSRAKYGVSAGVAAARSQFVQSTAGGAGGPQTAVISVPATEDLEAQAMKAFEDTLGRKAKPREVAAFASMYQAMAAGIQRANAAAEYQATTQAAGGGVGLTGNEARGFQDDLMQIGTRPTLLENPPAGVPRGVYDNPEERALREQIPVGFGEQLAQLQTLGEAVTAAAAGKNTLLGGGEEGGLRFIEEEQPPDASVAAANFARNTHPKAAARTDLAGALNMFLNIIGSRLGA